jgi:hypothetical protein
MPSRLDGIAERLRHGTKRELVLAAWGFTAKGLRLRPTSIHFRLSRLRC